jgi:hypothetical protein
MIGSLDTVQAGGTLGESVIKHLLAANFTVTALTRDPLKIGNSFPSAVKVVKTNYDSVESFVPPLEGQDAVVDLINRNQWEASIGLIDAAISAKVPHFIPSSFGLDMSKPEACKKPPLLGKAKMEDYIITKSEEGVISFTAIQVNMILTTRFPNRSSSLLIAIKCGIACSLSRAQ